MLRHLLIRALASFIGFFMILYAFSSQYVVALVLGSLSYAWGLLPRLRGAYLGRVQRIVLRVLGFVGVVVSALATLGFLVQSRPFSTGDVSCLVLLWIPSIALILHGYGIGIIPPITLATKFPSTRFPQVRTSLITLPLAVLSFSGISTIFALTLHLLLVKVYLHGLSTLFELEEVRLGFRRIYIPVIGLILLCVVFLIFFILVTIYSIRDFRCIVREVEEKRQVHVGKLKSKKAIAARVSLLFLACFISLAILGIAMDPSISLLLKYVVGTLIFCYCLFLVLMAVDPLIISVTFSHTGKRLRRVLQRIGLGYLT